VGRETDAGRHRRFLGHTPHTPALAYTHKHSADRSHKDMNLKRRSENQAAPGEWDVGETALKIKKKRFGYSAFCIEFYGSGFFLRRSTPLMGAFLLG
jgi:hypothetical protein